MNTTQLHEASSLVDQLAGRYDLPTPLFDEEGGGDYYPSDENEVDP